MPRTAGSMARRGIVLCAAVLAINGCATPRPLLDHDARFERAGESGVEADIDDCVARAKERSTGGGRLASEIALIVLGSAALGGFYADKNRANTGDSLLGAAIGAGIGAILGLTQAGIRTEQNKTSFKTSVERCLEERGYRLRAWE